MSRKKVLLCILDGFGYSENTNFNATIDAKYIWDLFKTNQSCLIEASGEAVGLPAGQIGNSEVGHLTIGSGRIIQQKLPLISNAIKDGSILNNETLLEFTKTNHDKTFHVMGLFSKGGVHSHLDHILFGYKFLKSNGIAVKLHLFLDGRDVGYKDALGDIAEHISNGDIDPRDIATIQGRFYAMDRDNRLDRTEAAWNAIAHGNGVESTDPIGIIKQMYHNGLSDETMPPIVLNNYQGVTESDVFWMINFRTDRIKQILTKIIGEGYHVLSMVSVDEKIDNRSNIIFKQDGITDSLSQVISDHGLSQLKIAETEKYAHVTYFLNGGDDIQFNQEDRILIPSPGVKNYEDTPKMSSEEITKKAIAAIASNEHDVIIMNYANADMIGHTGNMDATVESLRFLDECLKALIPAAIDQGFEVLITADHGNAEEMKDSDEINKAHTTNKVPLIYIGHKQLKCRDGLGLKDIAPSILDILEIDKPIAMTGASVF